MTAVMETSEHSSTRSERKWRKSENKFVFFYTYVISHPHMVQPKTTLILLIVPSSRLIYPDISKHRFFFGCCLRRCHYSILLGSTNIGVVFFWHSDFSFIDALCIFYYMLPQTYVTTRFLIFVFSWTKSFQYKPNSFNICEKLSRKQR